MGIFIYAAAYRFMHEETDDSLLSTLLGIVANMFLIAIVCLLFSIPWKTNQLPMSILLGILMGSVICRLLAENLNKKASKHGYGIALATSLVIYAVSILAANTIIWLFTIKL
jgi:hypothetical protein